MVIKIGGVSKPSAGSKKIENAIEDLLKDMKVEIERYIRDEDFELVTRVCRNHRTPIDLGYCPGVGFFIHPSHIYFNYDYLSKNCKRIFGNDISFETVSQNYFLKYKAKRLTEAMKKGLPVVYFVIDSEIELNKSNFFDNVLTSILVEHFGEEPRELRIGKFPKNRVLNFPPNFKELYRQSLLAEESNNSIPSIVGVNFDVSQGIVLDSKGWKYVKRWLFVNTLRYNKHFFLPKILEAEDLKSIREVHFLPVDKFLEFTSLPNLDRTDILVLLRILEFYYHNSWRISKGRVVSGNQKLKSALKFLKERIDSLSVKDVRELNLHTRSLSNKIYRFSHEILTF